MNNLDKQYQKLLSDIIQFGVKKEDRTGTGTISLLGYQFRHKISEGFPLLTTKKMAWKTMVTELLWFLRGDTNIKYLVDNGCNIWNGDAYKNYQNKMTEWFGNETQLTQEEFINKIKNDELFSKQWGELGPIYGNQWRDWGGKTDTQLSTTKREDGFYDYILNHIPGIDQLSNVIKELNTNPDSRRLMVSAWNVGELDKMVLPPCHYGFQLYTRPTTRDEKIVNPGKYRALSLMWNQRSVDTFLGLPFNIASYGLLLTMIADEVGMIPDELIGNLGDTHLYLNHIEQAKEQISREPMELPTVHVRDGIHSFMPGDIILENYKSHPSIKAPLSN